MDLNEFIDRLKIAQDRLPNLLLLSYLEIAHDAKARIESRIIESGINADGRSFNSIKPYGLAYLKKKQGFTITGGKARKGKKKDASGNIIQGRYKGYVDFDLTGQMWSNIQVLTDFSNLTSTGLRVSVGARSQDNINKLVGNAFGNGKWSGRGEILDLSEDELSILAQNLETNLQDHFNSFFI